MTTRALYLSLLLSLDDDDLDIPYLAFYSKDPALYQRLCVEHPDAVIWTHDGTSGFTLCITNKDTVNVLCVSFPNKVRQSVAS